MPIPAPAAPPKPRAVILILALLLLIGGLVATDQIDPKSWFAAKDAPDAVFATLTGQKIDLKTLHGKPVLITFWASDCPSCIAEIPHLTELYRRFHPKGFEIIAVAMAYNPPNTIVEAVKAYSLPYPVALDLTSAHSLAFGNVQFTPTTFLISPEGKIARSIVGPFDPSDISTQIETTLGG